MQRGKKSIAALAVATEGTAFTRLAPPSGLSEAELQVWLRTVNGLPAEWFQSEHVPLLTNYCRHVVTADLLDAQLKAFAPEWLKEDAGLERYSLLLDLFGKETKMIQSWARSLRLTHQSRYKSNVASTRSVQRGPRPWQG